MLTQDTRVLKRSDYDGLRTLSLSHSLNTRARLRRVLHRKSTSRLLKCLIYAELLRRKHGEARW
jgi:hypothetical protein